LAGCAQLIARTRCLQAQRDHIQTAHRNSAALAEAGKTRSSISRGSRRDGIEASFQWIDLFEPLLRNSLPPFQSAMERAGLGLQDTLPTVYPSRSTRDPDMWERSCSIFFPMRSSSHSKDRSASKCAARTTASRPPILLVRDTGVGVPAKELPRLFERFHRGLKAAQLSYSRDPRNRSRAGGELVKLHGGGISVESQEARARLSRLSSAIRTAHLSSDRSRRRTLARIDLNARRGLHRGEVLCGWLRRVDLDSGRRHGQSAPMKTGDLPGKSTIPRSAVS